MNAARSAFVTLTLLAATLTANAAEPAGFAETVLPFFKAHCLRCHDDTQQKGDFRLDTLSRDFGDQAVAQRWAEALFRMTAGEMPPKKEKQPTAEALGKAAEWISARVKEGEASRMAKRGPVAHYRLSREEYGHTVYDLLGAYFDVTAPGAFNDDPRWHGFDRIGSLLSLSPSHVDRYFKAAETVLGRAMPDQPPAPLKGRREANAGQEMWLRQQGLAGPVRWLLWPGRGQPLFNVTAPGRYRIRVQLSGVPSFKGRLPHLALWHDGLKRAVAGRDVSVPEGTPAVVEIEAFLSEGGFHIVNESPGMLADGHTASNTEFTFVNSQATRPPRPTGYKLFDDDGKPIFPMLMVDWAEWEGPLLTDADRKKQDGLVPAAPGGVADIRVSLKRLADRAWRRPATDAEIDRYVKVAQGELAAGETPRSACRTAMAGVLTSKNFYYLEEGSPTERRATVNDWELASRLSYFLWSSLPDDDLFAAARAGKLREPAVLKAELSRMLGDAKAARFTDSFPRQWLQLHRVGMFPPDPGLFPDYDKWLERCMTLETTQFFAAVFQENLSLREFLLSDWTIVNPRLAAHYGMPPLPESGFQKVKLRPEDHRGGVLTQASVLSLTSDGTRHRPVHRGVWVSEAVFGRTPPPPPPNVEPLEPTPGDKPKATIRQQLEAHATHATCASCHRKIDPLGFGFENFDAVGRWRTEEKTATGKGANPPVDAAGTLPDGRAFKGPDEFKQLLAQDLDRFAEAFVGQLATYALRRVMTVDDAAQIRAITAASKADGYKLRTVIGNLVASDLFLKR